jgi:hypothetical protein
MAQDQTPATTTKAIEAKHTPGPWLIYTTAMSSGMSFRIYTEERDICRIPTSWDGERNVRLIAAAPDLYEACRAAFSILHPIQGPADDPGHKVVAKLIDALAKAGGVA